MTASELRQRFRAIPKAARDANQGFAIRVWRGISWIEKCEQLESSDDEARLIFGWIAFNALYGLLGSDGRAEPDRQSMGSFLAQVWRLDERGLLRHQLCKKQLPVLRLVENKFLLDRFWADPKRDSEHELRQLVRKYLARFGGADMLPIFQTLFDRMYVMRNQVFHGASTKGSSLNRRAVQSCSYMLIEFVPVMIEVMIDSGANEKWGEVCYPPVS